MGWQYYPSTSAELSEKPGLPGILGAQRLQSMGAWDPHPLLHPPPDNPQPHPE